MIDITDDVIGILSEIDGIEGRVYRRWPKTKVRMPAILVSRISGVATLTDADGSEIIANLTYSIDINAEDLKAVDRIASETVDALSMYNMHRTGMTDFYDDFRRVYRVILTFNGTIDKRGNTFTN